MLPRLLAALATAVILGTLSTPAAGQDLLGATTLAMTATASPAAQASLFPTSARPTTPSTEWNRGKRPALLPALYISTIALQALDAHTTMTALKQGGTEANPLMKGVAGNKGALLAVKASAAAGTIYLAEKMWRKNRVGALALMAIVNGVTAVVVANNYKVINGLR